MRILALRAFAPELIGALEALAPVTVLPGLRDPGGADPEMLRQVRAAVTGGGTGFSVALMDACPNLRLVHFIGAGIDDFDLAAARRRGLRVSTGRGANASSVADHAMALLLGALRRLPDLHAEVRDGVWNQNRTVPQLTGKRVGIIGMGEIGTRIAQRLSGFEVEVAHVSSSPKPHLPWRQMADATELAAAADHLIVACPLTPETRGMVDSGVLAALGPQGVLVNIGRGEVVDTEALIAAVRGGVIAGAGLDVVAGEPEVPAALRSLPGVLLTPHIAALSPESQSAMRARAVENVRAVLAGGAPAAAIL